MVTPLLEIAPRLHLPDGTRVTRDNATIGPVVGDLGAVPDVGALHNDPVLPGEWVDVADGTRDQDVVAGWDPQLMLISARSSSRPIFRFAGIPTSPTRPPTRSGCRRSSRSWCPRATGPELST